MEAEHPDYYSYWIEKELPMEKMPASHSYWIEKALPMEKMPASHSSRCLKINLKSAEYDKAKGLKLTLDLREADHHPAAEPSFQEEGELLEKETLRPQEEGNPKSRLVGD